MKEAFDYILSNAHHTTLYVGVTNDIARRMHGHKSNLNSGFTAKCNVDKLLYYERIEGIKFAIQREKNLKNWNREWKWNLIKEFNPELNDLSAEMLVDYEHPCFNEGEAETSSA
jgi:putative endonuclease